MIKYLSFQSCIFVLNRLNAKHLLRNFPVQISKKISGERFTFCLYYFKKMTSIQQENHNITWTYDLTRDRHAAVLFLFRLRGDTASRWLSEPKGSVYDRMGNPVFCPVSKTNAWMQTLSSVNCHCTSSKSQNVFHFTHKRTLTQQSILKFLQLRPLGQFV